MRYSCHTTEAFGAVAWGAGRIYLWQAANLVTARPFKIMSVKACDARVAIQPNRATRHLKGGKILNTQLVLASVR